MFEAIILLALLGVILLFIVTGDQKNRIRKVYFIDLSTELKPATKKSSRKWAD
jgi:hypothetical protein